MRLDGFETDAKDDGRLLAALPLRKPLEDIHLALREDSSPRGRSGRDSPNRKEQSTTEEERTTRSLTDVARPPRPTRTTRAPLFLLAETPSPLFFSDFLFMVVMRPHHNCMKRARSQSMPTSEALPQACLIARENAPRLGRAPLRIDQAEACAASLLHTTLGNVW